MKHLKLHNPLVLISVFFVLFVYLRYFFIVYGWSGLVQADNQYLNSTILIYVFLHISFCVLCIPFTALRRKQKLPLETSNLTVVKMYFWLGVVSIVLFSAITFGKYGTLGWFVPSKINIWQSLTILQIPINFVQVIILHYIFNSSSNTQKIQFIVLLSVIVFIMGSRGAFTVLFIYYVFYNSVFNLRVTIIKYLLLLLIIFPASIAFLTLLKFNDQNFTTSISTAVLVLTNLDFWTWLFGVAYGRYYMLESSVLILQQLDNFNHYAHNFFFYLSNNFVPSFINPDKISITRLNCTIISPGRWSETTSCSISLPFFLFYDSGYFAFLYFIILSSLLLFVWRMLHNTNQIFLKLVYVFSLQQFMFYFNWDIASLNYVLYQLFFFAPALILLKVSIKSKA